MPKFKVGDSICHVGDVPNYDDRSEWTVLDIKDAFDDYYGNCLCYILRHKHTNPKSPSFKITPKSIVNTEVDGVDSCCELVMDVIEGLVDD